ncbi:hypothetical protein SO694_00018489 [Aureococcus anophagefferens]|uniref:SRCR domain-containing protein n=1 Tax=Aureococcus anophagefferens TaxID=44056 RepID=A0ABR1G0U7_AURAN|nr:DUF2237-containing protein [Aureococcus anophagefferens]KAH8055644.1 DUF2237-containing protein [Aureococcus anophagefferens]
MRAVLLLAQITATTAYKNVLGKELEHCSGAGMALTGYTREGQCVDRYDDAGSHHICINMKSTSNGNFCDVTGQPNWCASAMRCDDGTGSYGAGECDVENWFASYLSRAGGCDKIQEIVCEATNMEAYIAYTKSAQHAEARACLEQRCGISAAISDDEAATATAGFSVPWVAEAAAGSVLVGVAGFVATRKTRRDAQAVLGTPAKEVGLV